MEDLQTMFMEMAQGFEFGPWSSEAMIFEDHKSSKRARCKLDLMPGTSHSHVSGFRMYEMSGRYYHWDLLHYMIPMHGGKVGNIRRGFREELVTTVEATTDIKCVEMADMAGGTTRFSDSCRKWLLWGVVSCICCMEFPRPLVVQSFGMPCVMFVRLGRGMLCTAAVHTRHCPHEHCIGSVFVLDLLYQAVGFVLALWLRTSIANNHVEILDPSIEVG